MNQFLRLMFSPVAGRMVRTLFLERLRAERELAPPKGHAARGHPARRLQRGPRGLDAGPGAREDPVPHPTTRCLLMRWR